MVIHAKTSNEQATATNAQKNTARNNIYLLNHANKKRIIHTVRVVCGRRKRIGPHRDLILRKAVRRNDFVWVPAPYHIANLCQEKQGKNKNGKYQVERKEIAFPTFN